MRSPQTTQPTMRAYDPPTPREAAKHLIRRDVLRGYSIHDIVCGAQGVGMPAGTGTHAPYSVGVHGHTVEVTEWDGQRCHLTFKLETLVAEIQAQHAQAVAQPSLFEEVSA